MYYQVNYSPRSQRFVLYFLAHDLEPFVLEDRKGKVLYDHQQQLNHDAVLKVVVTTKRSPLFIRTANKHKQLLITINDNHDATPKAAEVEPLTVTFSDVLHSVVNRTIAEIVGEFSIL